MFYGGAVMIVPLTKAPWATLCIALQARMRLLPKRRGIPSIMAAVMLTMTSCGGSGESQDAAAGSELAAAVASYDIVAGRPGRFMVGVYSVDQTRLLAYGTVTLSFTFLGDDGASQADVGPVTASFMPIPGQGIDVDAAGPRLVAGSEATGVYGAPDVELGRSGFWEVAVEADLDGRTHGTTAAFEVLEESDLPAPGDEAPLTIQPLAGDSNVDAKAIDSRASSEHPIPDPELHDITVADAVAARRPMMVVVSTPTFCFSRFCGPITDSVAELALRFGDRMEFIHLEVWEDFEANAVNPAASEWIAPTSQAEGREPWVFVVDRHGVITQRFDNVATDAELLAAVEAVLENTAGEPKSILAAGSSRG